MTLNVQYDIKEKYILHIYFCNCMYYIFYTYIQYV